MNEKRVAVVTGGGSGIGAAVAREFAKEGISVAVVGRRKEQLQQIAEEISGACEVLVLPEDLSDPNAPGRVIDAVIEKWGRLDIIVNNAAYICCLPFEECTREQLCKHVDVNMLAPYYLVQQALPYLKQSAYASIVNISSSSASLSIPGQTMYGATKAALEYLTKSWAAELAPKIRVNCIAPGPIDTPIHLTWAGDDVAGAYKRMTSELPLGRMGKDSEIAAWVNWLCAEQASFVTGTIIPVDGGQVLPGALSRISQ